MRLNWRNYPTYLRLHRALRLARDHVAYPLVLAHTVQQAGLDRETATKTAITHALTGDIGITLALVDRHLNGAPLTALADLSGSHTRTPRGERVTEALAHYTAEARTHGGFVPLIAERLTGEPHDDYRTTITLLASAPHITTRKAAQAARLMTQIAGWDLDTEGSGAIGPNMTTLTRTGLDLITPASATEPAELRFTLLVADTAESLDHPFGEGLDPHGVDATLTALARLDAGTYYVGMNTDQMQAELIRAPRSDLARHAWVSRAAVLPHRYLGEKNGWYGPVTHLKTVYRDTGHIAVRRAPA